MIYTLKTRAITGDLVPLNGEHHPYPDFHSAWAEARAWTARTDQIVYVVNAWDTVVENTAHLVQDGGGR